MVDDFPIVRMGLHHLLHGRPDLSVCGEAGAALDARAAIRAAGPDLVILEPALVSGEGLELISALRREHPRLPILAYSRRSDAALAERAVRAGAQGFLSKREGAEALLDAIRQVLGGGVHLRAEVVALATREREATGVPALSDRELEVFRLLGQGRSSREIAEGLGISIKTVGTHRSNIMRKLGVRSAAQLLHQAVEWTAGLRRREPRGY